MNSTTNMMVSIRVMLAEMKQLQLNGTFRDYNHAGIDMTDRELSIYFTGQVNALTNVLADMELEVEKSCL